MLSLILVSVLAGQPDPAIVAANAEAAHKCEEKHDRIKAKVGDLTVRRKIITKKSLNRTRYGGGVGYNGFGGAGGYAGYSESIAGTAGGIGATIYNFGFGYANPGNAKREELDEEIDEREIIYPDRNYYGGPLTIRNPYVK